MKKIIVILLCALFCFTCVACDFIYEEQKPNKVSFSATVTEVCEGSILVEPDKGTSERNSSDKISVSLSGIEGVPALAVGDRVCIEHDGMIKETYPVQLGKAYSITKIA